MPEAPRYRYFLGDRDTDSRRFRATESCPVIAGSVRVRQIGLMYARLPSYRGCDRCRPHVPAAPDTPSNTDLTAAGLRPTTELGRRLLEERRRRRQRQAAEEQDRQSRGAAAGQSIRAVSGGLPGLGKRH